MQNERILYQNDQHSNKQINRQKDGQTEKDLFLKMT